MKRLLSLAFASILVAAAASAQTSFSIDLAPVLERAAGDEGGYAQPSVAGAVEIEQLLREERIRLSYNLSAGTFASPGDWHYVEHGGGGRYRFDLGPAARHHLFVGGDVTLRRNGDSWEAADYTGLGAFANLELHPGPTTIVRAGYRLDRRVFPSAADLDHLQHGVFVSGLRSLRTRTTLIGEVYAGLKRYEGGPLWAAVPEEVPSVAAEDALSSSLGRGQGRGVGGQRLTIFPATTAAGPTGSASVARARQVTVFARVAQSLADRTGLTFDVQRRDVFGDVPAAVVTTPARFFDDGVYDDPFASELTMGRVGFKTILRRDIEIGGSGMWEDKRYPHTPALAPDGGYVPDGPARHDEIWRGVATVTIPVSATLTGPLAVDLTARYEFTSHDSTDAYYRYRSHAFGIGAVLSY
jgi:hypothetical protein